MHQAGTPHSMEALAANPAAERCKKQARQKYIQGVTAVGRANISGPAAAASPACDCQLTNSDRQRTNRILRLSDTWNTRHNWTISGGRPYLMIVVPFETKLMWLALAVSVGTVWAQPADLVLRNGKIVTLEQSAPEAQ